MATLLCLLGGRALAQEGPVTQVVISIAEQRLAVFRDGTPLQKYRVSTSRFGVGDSWASYKTPLGRLHVCDKIGGDLALGAVLKNRCATGEVLAVDAPGRDPIVTRILWLEGDEEQNRHARERGIYIHGTPEEKRLGQPVSWGCIRMRSSDVAALYEALPVGTQVVIVADRLPRLLPRPIEVLPVIAARGGEHSGEVPSRQTMRPLPELSSAAVSSERGTEGERLRSLKPIGSGAAALMSPMAGSILFAGLENPSLPAPAKALARAAEAVSESPFSLAGIARDLALRPVSAEIAALPVPARAEPETKRLAFRLGVSEAAVEAGLAEEESRR